MKKTRFLRVLAPALALSLVLAACSTGGGEKTAGANKKDGSKTGIKQEISVLESAEFSTLDSVMGQDVATFSILNNTVEGLYRLDENQKPIPALLEGEPKVSPDGKTYTVKIRDAKWSNGDPVTAENFVTAWRRAVDPKTASVYGPYMMAGRIVNADKITDSKVKMDPKELGVKALDEKTLEIKFQRPTPIFDELMAFPTFYPEPTNAVNKLGKKFGTSSENAISNGPFIVEGWNGPDDVNWKLVKNETYWDAASVKLETINFNVQKDAQASLNMFQAGEADITSKLAQQGVISQIENDPQLQRYLETTTFFMKMNQKNPALKNVNIRRAIATGFDREALVNNVLNNGSVPAGFVVPTNYVKDPNGKDFREKYGDLIKYDAEAAKASWKKGLAELGKKELSFDYYTYDSETSKLVDAFLKNQLETNLPGFKLNVKPVPFPKKLDLENKEEYDLLAAGWGADYNDPMSFSDLWVTDGGNNHMSYSNEKYDQLIEDANNKYGTDVQKYFEVQQEAERIFLQDDAGVAPIYQRAVNRMISKRVKGFVYHMCGPEYSFKWAEVVEDK